MAVAAGVAVRAGSSQYWDGTVAEEAAGGSVAGGGDEGWSLGGWMC